MSKERARLRAEREALSRQRQANQRAAADRQRTRRQRRRMLGRPAGLRGRRGRVNARTKERRAVIASCLLVIVVLTYLLTGSIAMVIGVLLIASIATPALAAAFPDRSKK